MGREVGHSEFGNRAGFPTYFMEIARIATVALLAIFAGLHVHSAFPT